MSEQDRVSEEFEDIYGGETTDVESMASEGDSVIPRDAGLREVLADNAVTGEALEPFVDVKGSGIGLLDAAGGVAGVGMSAMDAYDAAVKDVGPFEKAATYAAAPLSVVPLLGKPAAKGLKAAGKSIDNMFGMGEKKYSQLMQEVEEASSIESKAVQAAKENVPFLQKLDEVDFNESYGVVRAQGFDPLSNTLRSLDSQDIMNSYGPAGVRDISKLIKTKADTLRYNNPELKESLVDVYNSDPDLYADHMEHLENASNYIGRWSSEVSMMIGDTVLDVNDIIRRAGTKPPLSHVEGKLNEAMAFGTVDPADAADFLNSYKMISNYDTALFHMSRTSALNYMADHYNKQLGASNMLEALGINYSKMDDKDFFQKYAEVQYVPSRDGLGSQPVAKALPGMKEYTGYDEPLMFIHGTTGEFEEFSDAAIASNTPTSIQKVYDSVGFHVGTPSQATHFSGKQGQQIPVVLKKTRKITDAIEDMSGELGFIPEKEFYDNPLNMQNGVLTERGLSRLVQLYGHEPSYVGRELGENFRDYLSNHGVTYIPYINDVEDVGDLSVWVLSPDNAKQVGKFAEVIYVYHT